PISRASFNNGVAQTFSKSSLRVKLTVRYMDDPANAQSPLLQRQYRGGIARGERVHVAEYQLLGAVAAEFGFVVFAHDGESVQNVGGFLARKAVQIEVQRVEPGHAVAAVFLVPFERFAVITQVAREWRQVAGGVGQPQHFATHEVADRGRAQRLPVYRRGDQRKLFDDIPVQVCRLNFLASDV